MKTTKKLMTFLLTGAMSFCMLTACGGSAKTETSAEVTTVASESVMPTTTAAESTTAVAESPETSQSGDSATREITDLAGNKLTVPENIKSVAITSWKGAFEDFILLGHADLVSCMSDTSRYVWIRHAYPELLNVPDYGSFNDVNVEELVKLNADIIFSPEAAGDANTQMQQLGLPLYVDGIQASGDPYEGGHEELLAIADLIGETEKAQAYLDWEKKWLDTVSERVSDIPETERKTVFLLRNSTTETFNNMNILGVSVGLAGGINVAGDAFSDKFYGEVSAEELVAWDPDFIFQYSVGSTCEELETRYQDEILTDNRLANLKAVKSGDCYIMPYGIANWGGKLETSLGVLAMAKTMYPERFEDISVREVAAEFYKTFMNYDIDDEDWAVMCHNFTGANEMILD